MSRGDFGGPSYGATSASYHRTPMAKEKGIIIITYFLNIMIYIYGCVYLKEN